MARPECNRIMLSKPVQFTTSSHPFRVGKKGNIVGWKKLGDREKAARGISEMAVVHFDRSREGVTYVIDPRELVCVEDNRKRKS